MLFQLIRCLPAVLISCNRSPIVGVLYFSCTELCCSRILCATWLYAVFIVQLCRCCYRTNFFGDLASGGPTGGKLRRVPHNRGSKPCTLCTKPWTVAQVLPERTQKSGCEKKRTAGSDKQWTEETSNRTEVTETQGSPAVPPQKHSKRTGSLPRSSVSAFELVLREKDTEVDIAKICR